MSSHASDEIELKEKSHLTKQIYLNQYCNKYYFLKNWMTKITKLNAFNDTKKY